MQDALDRLQMPISLDSLNKIYSQMLKDKDYPYECMISMLAGDSVIRKVGNAPSSFLTLQTRRIPLRRDASIEIQAQFTNPNGKFFSEMGILLVSTTILVVLVVCCIVYQIRIVYKLKKIFQIREDFSYAMIHDMKTPLTSIFSVLNLLHSGRLDDKPEMKEKYYRIAEGEADHLLALTNKVLTLSKLENHKLEMNRQVVPLEPMMEKLLEKFKAKAGKPVRFTLDLQAAEAYADGEYLLEVVSNLIDNAVKYSGDSVDIQISSVDDGGYTLIKVHDNGLGISEKDQRVIFNKYERGAAGSRTRKGGAAGFGLGLNFVRQVVEAHEGQIIVNSIKGEFTEFIIYLPKTIQEL